MGRDVANPQPWRAVRSSRTADSSPKFVPLANLRKLRECHQVAAVCYRVRNDSVEFLLVRTRGGRWIFPKGNAEPGLTHAQAAALGLSKKPASMAVWRKRASVATRAGKIEFVRTGFAEDGDGECPSLRSIAA